jgi:DNA-binding winged helix-turn-helix (wHTH) protein/TolB-like protein/Tfp pilus assembly protein PilF
MSEQKSRFYEFDDFRIDAVKRRLLRMDEFVHLPPKVFDTLLILIEHRGRVLDKDELMETIWSDTIVEENNLTQNISAIRKALGENRGEHRYVVTVPGRGYRFVADVREIKTNGAQNGNEFVRAENEFEEKRENLPAKESEIQSVPASSPQSYRNFRQNTGLILLVFVLLAGGFALLFLRQTFSSAEKAASTTEVKSIAVLPFKPLNADETEVYIGTGMADALITKLSNIRQIKVRPTSSILRYSNPSKDSLAAGNELGVDVVLDGHFQRSGDDVRLTVQLIRISDGATLWAKAFDESFKDIFDMQDSISEQVADALKIKLNGEEQLALERRFTENTEAYRAYLKALYFMNKAKDEEVKKCVGYFQQAASLDPNYALAYAGLADCYLKLHTRGISTEKEQAITLARAAVTKAIEIDDTVAYAHSALGFIAFRYDWDFTAAEREYKRARQLDPAYLNTWFYFYLMTMNRFTEAEAEFKKVQESRPLTTGDISLYYYFLRQYDRAEQELRNSLDINSNNAPVRSSLGLVYEQKGMYKEALSEFQKNVELSGNGNQGLTLLAHIYAVSGRKDEAKKLLAEISKRSKQDFFWADYSIAVIYAGLGEKDEAIDYLERAYAEHSLGPAWLRFDPRLDNLRAEPRFQEFMRRVGLPM